MLFHRFPFDTAQMPLNCLDTTFRSFETEVLPEMNRRGMAALGMKSLGGSGELLREDAVVVNMRPRSRRVRISDARSNGHRRSDSYQEAA